LHKALIFALFPWTLICIVAAVIVALPNMDLPGDQAVGGFTITGVLAFWLVVVAFIGFLAYLTRPKFWSEQ
jgi:uncharacterized membrane protein